jgi:SAM-dependent methyltransferase
MEYIAGVSSLYIRKFKRKLKQYNKPGTLPSYFAELIGDKKHVRIAEVGAGPINTIGNEWPGVEVEVWASDVLSPQYGKLWQEHGATPVVPVQYQDMENLAYIDELFDIVHCVNALDHTKDARKALGELIRVCKKGGWVYLRHAPDQMNRFGGKHYWNARFENGLCVFHGKDEVVILRDFKAHLEGDLIVALWQKT